MISPIGKRLIVKPVEVKHGTLLLSGVKPTQFLICSIGDEVTKVKIGDVVYLGKHVGAEIDHENETFLVIEESSILAKVD